MILYQATQPTFIREELRQQIGQLKQKRYRLRQIVTVFQEDEVIYPMQCTGAIEHLRVLRHATEGVTLFLRELDVTEALRPAATLEKLYEFEERITETMLILGMFRAICQDVTMDRITIHLFLRSRFPVLLRNFDDTRSQLIALLSTERLGHQ